MTRTLYVSSRQVISFEWVSCTYKKKYEIWSDFLLDTSIGHITAFNNRHVIHGSCQQGTITCTCMLGPLILPMWQVTSRLSLEIALKIFMFSLCILQRNFHNCSLNFLNKVLKKLSPPKNNL